MKHYKIGSPLGPQPVTIQGTVTTSDPGVGLPTDAVATTDTGNFSLVSLVKRSLTRWTTFFTLFPASLGQKAKAESLAVTLSNENVQDYFLTGPATQTATVNNILTNPSGTDGLDCTGYRSFCIQVVSTGTGGTFIFEGSNSLTTNFQAIPVSNQATGAITTSAITATASQIGYIGTVNFRYLRLRIVTTITGGSIQAFSYFKQSSFTPSTNNVAQSSAANLLVTAQPSNTVNTTPWLVTTVPSAAQGTGTFFTLISAATTNAAVVKGSAGTLGTIVVANVSASVKYFKLFNKATTPIPGTDVPVYTIAIPPNATVCIPLNGMRLGTGIGYCCVSGIALTDATALLAANEVVVSGNYV